MTTRLRHEPARYSEHTTPVRWVGALLGVFLFVMGAHYLADQDHQDPHPQSRPAVHCTTLPEDTPC